MFHIKFMKKPKDIEVFTTIDEKETFIKQPLNREGKYENF